MKKMIMLLPVIIMGWTALAQDSAHNQRDFVKVNTLHEETSEVLQERIFKYPEFLQSTVVFGDGGVLETNMNYNRYFRQLFFINEKKDTLALAHPATYKMFIIGKDSFYFTGKGFCFLLEKYKDVHLAKEEVLSLIGKEKKGLYGTYSSVSSADSEMTYSNDEQQKIQWLKIDQNAIYQMEENFLLKDRFDNFFTADKKNFHNLFRLKQKELKQYLKENKVDYKKKEDLVKLLEFLSK